MNAGQIKTLLIKIIMLFFALYIFVGVFVLFQWGTCLDGGGRFGCEGIDIWTKIAACTAGILFTGFLVFFIKLAISEKNSNQHSSLNLENWPWK